MNGWWTVARLDEMMFRLMRNNADEHTKAWTKMQWLMLALREKVINLQAPDTRISSG